MIETKKETKTETVEREIQVAIICDICGKRSPRDDSWGDSFYKHHTYRLEGEERECWPEGGTGTRTWVDFCPSCFQQVIDNLKAQVPDFMINEKDIDY